MFSYRGGEGAITGAARGGGVPVSQAIVRIGWSDRGSGRGSGMPDRKSRVESSRTWPSFTGLV